MRIFSCPNLHYNLKFFHVKGHSRPYIIKTKSEVKKETNNGHKCAAFIIMEGIILSYSYSYSTIHIFFLRSTTIFFLYFSSLPCLLFSSFHCF
ncbi:hypothetical protein RIF29_33415 [Crotalaria pallida]|uniref:Uncharacterized protein n=1 Tax=Crotalaria pallida TaxID=3830 RepID=A0AAN9E7S6_CROPI